MYRHMLLVTFSLLASVSLATAQTPAETPPSTAPATNASEAMEEARTGDHWTYEARDEITGELKSTLTQTVTDASENEISIRVSWLGSANTAFFTYDRSWNVKNSGVWRYAPGDGTGISAPLAVGKSWRFKSNDVNTAASANFTRSGTSKVTAKESVTTGAGTFETYKIETSLQGVNTKNPANKVQLVQTTWYAPEINHWVKRSYELRIDGRVREKSSLELVDYGRR
jgi:hypothetical protein